MASLSWKAPPPIVIIGGDEDFLVGRELQNAIVKTGYSVTKAQNEADVMDALAVAQTFGSKTLILVPIKEITPETITALQAGSSVCAILQHEGALDEKKYPFLGSIPKEHRIAHNKPAKKQALIDLAVRFACAESDNLLAGTKTLDTKLAEALVQTVGTDLGVISFELSKVAALARAEDLKAIQVEHVRKLVRPTSEMDLQGFREALQQRDAKRLSRALSQIRKVSPTDPVMLLLRGKGGASDLFVQWLKVSLLIKKGLKEEDIALRMGVPGWILRDTIAACKKWDVPTLRRTISELALVDRGVFLGAPSPWVSLECCLLRACCPLS